MDDENLFLMTLLVATVLCILIFLASGCTSLLPLPGIDNHKGIFSAPRNRVVPPSEYYHP